jgi:hypothetical protein
MGKNQKKNQNKKKSVLVRGNENSTARQIPPAPQEVTTEIRKEDPPAPTRQPEETIPLKLQPL